MKIEFLVVLYLKMNREDHEGAKFKNKLIKWFHIELSSFASLRASRLIHSSYSWQSGGVYFRRTPIHG